MCCCVCGDERLQCRPRCIQTCFYRASADFVGQVFGGCPRTISSPQVNQRLHHCAERGGRSHHSGRVVLLWIRAVQRWQRFQWLQSAPAPPLIASGHCLARSLLYLRGLLPHATFRFCSAPLVMHTKYTAHLECCVISYVPRHYFGNMP